MNEVNKVNKVNETTETTETTDTAQHTAVQELMLLIDRYAETRHTCGDASYNAETKAARLEVKRVIGSMVNVYYSTQEAYNKLSDECWSLKQENHLLECDLTAVEQKVQHLENNRGYAA